MDTDTIIKAQEEETVLFLQAFTAYRKAFFASDSSLQLAPYNHIETRDSLPFTWAAYHQMLDDHARSLANDLNHFSYHISQVEAWSKVIRSYEIEDQLGLLIEFIDPIATTCVNYPYAIRSRFIFSVSHLSHQANLISDNSWSESKFPAKDKSIDYKIMLKIADRWSNFKLLEKEFVGLCNEKYINETKNFRNKYHHQYPPRFEHGHTNFVSRNYGPDGRVSYGFGYIEPLSLENLIPTLIDQHSCSLRCFEHYSNLAREQLSAIYSKSKLGN